MNKHLFQGVFCGGIFAAAITWIAASDAMTEGGGLALLASAVFGLAAGLCIGGLIAANFAMLAVEEKEAREAVARRVAETPVAA
jgi:MFS family permease